MKTPPPSSRNQSPSKPAKDANAPIVFSYNKITIPLSSTSQSSSSKPSQPIGNIGHYSSSNAFLPNTNNNKQKKTTRDLKPILESFLYSDLTSTLPELERWIRWSRTKGYIGGRIILSDNHLHLLASTKEGGIDDYQLPYSQGGVRTPILRHSFNATHLHLLERMLGCKNITGGIGYCGYCPACLSFHTYRNTFLNKKARIRKLESEMEELKDLIKGGDGLIRGLRREQVKAQTKGFTGQARFYLKKISRMEGWKDKPKHHFQIREEERDGLQEIRDKVLNCHSVLIQLPHLFVSVCCPAPLHPIYEAQDGWLKGRSLAYGRRTSEALKGILDGLEGSPHLAHGFVHLMRILFRKLVLEAVQVQHPDIQLTMEHQLHPFNKWDSAPDFHALVCPQGNEKGSGKAVEVKLDAGLICREVESRMRLLGEFVRWAIKHWNMGERSTAFRNWKKQVLNGIEVVGKSGIAQETVDIRLRSIEELLGTHCYLRRQPMENTEKFFPNMKKGIVIVKYYGEQRAAPFGIIDLLWRFVGFDGRGYGVQYTGNYRSGVDMKRADKMDGYYRTRDESLETVIDEFRSRRKDSASGQRKGD